MKNLTFKESLPLNGQPAEQLVMFLHGVGSNGSDLIELSPIMAEKFPKTHFISANGPYPYDAMPSESAFQWFSLANRNEEVLYQELVNSAPIVNNFIDQQLERLKLDDSKLVLVGFSQGTMMSLHVALRREKACAGVVGFSGCLVAIRKLQADLKSKPPTILIHGTDDQVVPAVLTTQAVRILQDLSCPVESHMIPGLGHSIDHAGLNLAISFLSKVL